MAKVAVVGLGYVGIPVAVQAASRGFKAVGIDLDEEKVNAINDGKSPLADEELEQALEKKPFEASLDYSDVSDADIVIIAVPTPVKGDLPDLTILKSATSDAGKHLKNGALLIIESTINPGVCDETLIPLLEKQGLTDGKDFFLAHCPERISPGDEWDLKDINRVVGSNTKAGLARAKEFYESILDAEIKSMETIKEAEAVKVVENSFRDINIAFVNELAMSFSLMGINLENVIDGASTKPFGYMPFRPGPGVGGHCIPVDPYYLIEYAKGFGFNHRFMQLAREINKEMPRYVVELTTKGLIEKGLKIGDSKIAVLGLSYKPDVDDLRESPSLEIISTLESLDAKVVSFDPYHTSGNSAKSAEAAFESADAVILATHHSDFKSIDPKTMADHGVKVFVDGRNMFRERKNEFIEAGLSYRGIGQS